MKPSLRLQILFFLIVITFYSQAYAGKYDTVLKSIQEQLLIHDSQQLQNELSKLEKQVKELPAQLNNQQLSLVQKQFTTVIRLWKRVEALYTAGNVDADMIDVPRYLDVFHTGNENIYKRLKRSFRSTKSFESILFKNSTKSFNALEYVLFANSSKSESLLTLLKAEDFRRIEIAQFIIKSLKQHVNTITTFYREDTRFVSMQKQALEDLVNVMIDSSYKLKTWRIGEPGGLEVKYKGKLNPKRMEYFYSNNAFQAVEAILLSHQQLFALIEKDSLNAQSNPIPESVESLTTVKKNIKRAIAKNQILLDKVKQSGTIKLELLNTKDYKQLHVALTRLHNSYYILLIEALGIKAKIIEADGD